MPQSRTLDVGLDGHHEAMAVASSAHEHGAEVTSLGTVGTRPCDLDHLIRTRQSQAQHLVFVSDAGAWGSWRSRDLTHKGQVCGVVAPALRPQQAGHRVHTDRRDAGQRARLMRAGELTPG
jgi:hypothetical protein